MYRLMNSLANNLGRCGKCIRQSFAAALGAWIAVAVVVMFTGFSWIAAAMAAGATLPSGLWLAHLTAYAARAARCRVSTATADAIGNVTRHSRRDLFPFFVKTFAAVALASVFQSLPTGARAQSTCPANLPFVCGGQYCCSGAASWYCSGYRGSVPNWRQMGTFCTNANSDEDVADLRSNCAILVHC
ncbi:MAG TPA: hypothetical protein VMD53_08300 [Rhizomicrobium sp.]|nr:hypothetical protein [Rhizomicrobium sp.]